MFSLFSSFSGQRFRGAVVCRYRAVPNFRHRGSHKYTDPGPPTGSKRGSAKRREDPAFGLLVSRWGAVFSPPMFPAAEEGAGGPFFRPFPCFPFFSIPSNFFQCSSAALPSEALLRDVFARWLCASASYMIAATIESKLIALATINIS